jgi:hypothetical protein
MSRCAEPPANTMATRAASTRGAGSTTDIGSGSGTATLTDSASNSVTANGVDGGTAGGTISNCASLNGDGLTVAVSSFTFTVVPAVNLQACNTLAVGAVTRPTFTTYTQGGWGADPHGDNPGTLLANNFATVYPSGVVVGRQPDFNMTFTSAPAVGDYLPAGGASAALNASLTDPGTSSSGVFGGQVLALEVNVDFSAATITSAGFGNVTLCHTGTSLDGQTVSSILGTMNTALGGGATLSGYSIASLKHPGGQLE